MILGIDTSHWQGVMDFPKAVSAGAKYNISRAGSINNVTGACYTDYQFPNNKYAYEHIPSGFYWYFRPNHDPNKQADYFSNLAAQSKQGPLTIDVEEQGGCTPEQMRDAVAKFIGRVYANTGIWCDIYTRATVWNPHSRLIDGVYVKAGVAESALWPRLNLHIARYGVTQPWWVGTMYKPRDWNTWLFWQFSADGNGRGPEFGATGSKSIDLNYFNGDESMLASHFMVQPFPPVPAEPEPVTFPRIARVVSPVTQRRSYSTDAAAFGLIPSGIEIRVHGTKTVGADEWAWLHPDQLSWCAVVYRGKKYLEWVT